MKALILGAGYGTRLMSGLNALEDGLREKYKGAIENKPKSLIPIAGKPLVEYLLEKIEKETPIKDVYVVTNHHFYSQFVKWRPTFSSSLSIKILNDGTRTNEKRLGVIGDLEFAVRTARIKDDLLVLAGDTLLEMDFGNLIGYFGRIKKDVISIYEEDESVLSRRGVVVTDTQGKVIFFLEKPKNPPSNLAAPIAYVLTKKTLECLPQFLEANYSKEQNFIERLIQGRKHEVYTFSFPKRYDIGDIDDYIAVDQEFSRRLKE